MLQLKRMLQWGHLIISGSFNQLEISEIEDLRIRDFAARGEKNFAMDNSEFYSFDRSLFKLRFQAPRIYSFGTKCILLV